MIIIVLLHIGQQNMERTKKYKKSRRWSKSESEKRKGLTEWRTDRVQERLRRNRKQAELRVSNDIEEDRVN